MTVQIGFLEPLEWTSETQKDFSISRLGGLPVSHPPFPLKIDLADRQRPVPERPTMPNLFASDATSNPTLCTDRRRGNTPTSLHIPL